MRNNNEAKTIERHSFEGPAFKGLLLLIAFRRFCPQIRGLFPGD